jgi:hypothetical protein
MFEFTSPWPQILADLSPFIGAVWLGWEIYCEKQRTKDQ